MKKGLTELVFIMDRSGSMTGLESDTIGGFNSLIKKQRRQEGEAIVTTVLFDDRYEILHDRFDLKAVKEMTENEYYTRGSTALLDAMGSTIQKTVNAQKHLLEDERAEKVIFVIITDGYENSSCEYTYSKVRNMVEREQNRNGWEFMFLGANMDAISEGARIGIRADRAVSYCCDEEGTKLNYKIVGKAICSMRSEKYEGGPSDDWKKEIEEDFKRRGKKNINK
jgi:hypothetical protein